MRCTSKPQQQMPERCVDQQVSDDNILPPGELIPMFDLGFSFAGDLWPTARLAPNGCAAEPYEKFAVGLIPRVKAVLEQHGLEAKSEYITVSILQELLTAECWKDEVRREKWFEFLLPTIKAGLD